MKPAKKLKKRKPKQRIRLDQTATMLEEFTRFLEEIENHRSCSLPSRKLVSDIFLLWSNEVAKDNKLKYQTNLIKGFGEFLLG